MSVQLQTSPGLWQQSPTGYLYQWQVSDDGLSGWSDIPGEIRSDFVFDPADYYDRFLRCAVSALNVVGESAPVYSDVYTVGGEPPPPPTTFFRGGRPQAGRFRPARPRRTIITVNFHPKTGYGTSTVVGKGNRVGDFSKMGYGYASMSAAGEWVKQLPYYETVLFDGPVGYWKCDEASGDLADSSGNGLTMTKNGSPTYRQTGPGTGNYGILTSASDYYIRGDTDSSPLDVGDVFTLEYWLKRGASQGSSQVLIQKVGLETYQLRINASNRIELNQYGIQNITTSSVSLTDTSSWHHIVSTKNGSTVKLYLDSVDVTGTVNNATLGNNNNDFGMMNPDGGTSSHIAVYPTALSATKVANHYAAMV
jgi:hypothetical protein